MELQQNIKIKRNLDRQILLQEKIKENIYLFGRLVNRYRVSRSDRPEVGHVGDGPHWESFVNQTVVDEHVRHAKHRNSKTLLRVNTLI
jgi:hypothetical protein